MLSNASAAAAELQEQEPIGCAIVIVARDREGPGAAGGKRADWVIGPISRVKPLSGDGAGELGQIDSDTGCQHINHGQGRGG